MGIGVVEGETTTHGSVVGEDFETGIQFVGEGAYGSDPVYGFFDQPKVPGFSSFEWEASSG